MVKSLGGDAGRLHTGHQVVMWDMSASAETPCSATSPPMHTALLPLMTCKVEHKSYTIPPRHFHSHGLLLSFSSDSLFSFPVTFFFFFFFLSLNLETK